MTSITSNPIGIVVSPASSDGTVWLGGNGNWADGATPGAPTFNTLQNVVDGINPTTGGWSELPGTACDPPGGPSVLQVRKGQQQWPLGTLEGSNSHWVVWGSASWDGKAFIIGAVGQHNTYNGNDMYRIRVTDPPAAVRMCNSAPMYGGTWEAFRYDGVEYIETYQHFFSVAEIVAHNIQIGGPNWGTPTDLLPEWGPSALHQYDGAAFDPLTGKHIRSTLGGQNCNAFKAWVEANGPIINLYDGVANGMRPWTAIPIFNPNAPTPKSAWTFIDIFPVMTNPPSQFLNFPQLIGPVPGTSQWVRMVGLGYTIYNFNVETMTPALGDGGYYGHGGSGVGDYSLRRRTASNRQYLVTGYPGIDSTLYEVATNGTKTTRVTPIPAAWTAACGIAVVGEKALICGVLPNVGYYDGGTGSTSFTDIYSGAGPTINPFNGIYGKWEACPEAECFLRITCSPADNIQVFRPPAAWNIFA